MARRNTARKTPYSPYFGVVLCVYTGKVRRVINPDYEHQFPNHHVDPINERMVYEHKDDWNIPIVPDSMTLADVARIQDFYENKRNYRPGDDE